MDNLSSSRSSNENDVELAHTILIPEEVDVLFRRIHRVPEHLRVNRTNQRVYEPVVVSIGPYHYGTPQLHVAEALKHKILKKFVSESGKDKSFFKDRILMRVDHIRSYYIGISKEKVTDETLVEMMLRDACFIIYAMGDENESVLAHHLGMGVAFLTGDFCMLENQIPFFVIRMLMYLRYQSEQLLCTYLSYLCFGDNRLECVKTSVTDEEASQPLHLLEAQRRILIQGDYQQTGNEVMKQPRRAFRPRWLRWRKYRKGEGSYRKLSLPFRSATELKLKGIHFRPSSNNLKDVRFKSYSCYGQLKLPIWFVNNSSKVLFLNMIAYEMSPESNTDFEVTSYINFMKALIEGPKDVKQLRENGILFSIIGSEEEVVKVYREIDTHGLDNEDIFHDVKMQIEQHCASKAKTWMIQLFYANFRTPWAVTAFLAAILLLILTFLQTYFTINPV